MKVLWLDFGEGSFKLVKYEKDIHAKDAYKFLYWKDFKGEELILAGSGTHKLLFSVAIDEYGVPKELKPDGAGDMALGIGRIDYWGSTLLEVLTPESIRPKIEEALCL